MEKKNFYYTYKISLLCGSLKNHYYYGQHSTNDLNDNYAGSGVILKKYYKKHGKIEGKTYIREILNLYNSQEELNIAERKLIGDLYQSDPLCINVIEGGGNNVSALHTPDAEAKSKQTRERLYGSSMGACHTPESQAKNIKTHTERYGSNCGQMHTEEVRKKIRNTVISKYGTAAGKLNLPESVEKSRKAQIEKYGHLAGQTHNPEVWAKARKTLEEKYGYMMAQCHTSEAKTKSIQTRIARYGSPVGALHTPGVQAKASANRRAAMIAKYGTLAGNLGSPESMRKRTISRQVNSARRRTVCLSTEFQEWYLPRKENFKRVDYAVRFFLSEKGYKLEDYAETPTCSPEWQRYLYPNINTSS